MLGRVYFQGRRACVISRRKSPARNDKPVTRGAHKQITVIAADTQPLSILMWQCREPEVRMTICRAPDCERRVQSGTRIIELLVSFDSEVRIGACGKLGRTSASG